MKKLESILSLAEAVDWKLSKALRDELDAIVEDVETFNPPFRAALKRASADIRAGRFVTQAVLERKFGLEG